MDARTAGPESAEHGRRLLDSLVEYAVFSLDGRGYVRTWNEGAARVFGYAAEEIVGRSGDRLFLPEDVEREIPAQEMRRAAADGRASDERWHRRKDGARFWAAGLMFPLAPADGAPEGFVKVVRDRTQSKRIEDLRSEDDKRLRFLADFLPTPVAYVGRDHRFSFNNVAYEDWVGLPLSEITGRPVRDVVGEEIYSRLRPRLDRALSGERCDSEELVPYAHGHRWVRASYIPHVDPDDQVLGVVAILFDISALKALEQELRSRGEILQGAVDEKTRELAERDQLLQQANDAILIRDVAGTISYWNRGAEELYGWPREEALGRRTDEILKTRFPRPLPEIQDALARAGRWQGRLLHRRRDGKELAVESRWVARRGPDGRPNAYLEINRDVTELYRTLEQLEESNRELEEFAYFASHDLQEPLRKVLINAERLDRAASADAESRAWIARINEGAQRMRLLIHDLLGYARINAAEVRSERVELAEVLRDVEEELREEIARTGGRLESGGLPAVLGDAGLLRSVLRNLLSNALKFRRPDAAPRVRIGAEREGADWRIGVADNGIGIERDKRELVFRPFKRLHRKEEYPGTGIGLAICKRAVERLGGRVWAEAGPDGGTVFLFTLPAAPEAR